MAAPMRRSASGRDAGPRPETDVASSAFDTFFALMADEGMHGPPLDPVRRGVDAHTARLAGEVAGGTFPGMGHSLKGAGRSQSQTMPEDAMDPDVAALLGLHKTPGGDRTLGPYLPRRHRGVRGSKGSAKGDVVSESLHRERSPAWTVQPGEIQILAAPSRGKEGPGEDAAGSAEAYSALPSFFTVDAMGSKAGLKAKAGEKSWREARGAWVMQAADARLAAEAKRVEQIKALIKLKQEHLEGRLESFLTRMDIKMRRCEMQEDLFRKELMEVSEGGIQLEKTYTEVLGEEVGKAKDLAHQYLRSNWVETGDATLGCGASHELVRWEVLMASIEHGHLLGRGGKCPFTFKRVIGDIGSVLAVAGAILVESGAEFAKRWGRGEVEGEDNPSTGTEGGRPRVKVMGVYKVSRAVEADSAIISEGQDETFVDFVEAAQKEILLTTGSRSTAGRTNPIPRARFAFPMGPIFSLSDDGAGAKFAAKFLAETTRGVEVRKEFALSTHLTSKVLSWLTPDLCSVVDARVFVCVEEVMCAAAKFRTNDAGLGFHPPDVLIAHATSRDVASALSTLSSMQSCPAFPLAMAGSSPRNDAHGLLKGVAGAELAVHALVDGVALHFAPARVMHLLDVACPAASTLLGSNVHRGQLMDHYKLDGERPAFGSLSTLHLVRRANSESVDVLPLVPAHLDMLFDAYVAQGVAPSLARVWSIDSECRGDDKHPLGGSEQLYGCVISRRQLVSGGTERAAEVPTYVVIFDVSPGLSYHHSKAIERFAATSATVPTIHREGCYHMLLRDYHPNERHMIVGQLCNWKGCRLPSHVGNLPPTSMVENQNHGDSQGGGAMGLPLCKFHQILAERFPGGVPKVPLGAGPPTATSVQHALLSRPQGASSRVPSRVAPGARHESTSAEKKSLDSLLVDGFVKTILSSSDALMDLATGEAERGVLSSTLVVEDLEGLSDLGKPAMLHLADEADDWASQNSVQKCVMRKIHDSLHLGDVPDGKSVPVGYLNSPWQTSTGRVLVGQRKVEGAPAVLAQRMKLSRDRLKLIQPAHLMSGYSLMCSDIEERLKSLDVELAQTRQLSQEYRKVLRKPGRKT